jgi:hypothetical protein
MSIVVRTADFAIGGRRNLRYLSTSTELSELIGVQEISTIVAGQRTPARTHDRARGLEPHDRRAVASLGWTGGLVLAD